MKMNITQLKEQTSGVILDIHMDDQAKQHLAHVGLYEGAHIRMERSGKMGHPCTLLVCGNFLMLRFEDAMRIEVEEQ